jgi:hypothetical protein
MDSHPSALIYGDYRFMCQAVLRLNYSAGKPTDHSSGSQPNDEIDQFHGFSNL